MSRITLDTPPLRVHTERIRSHVEVSDFFHNLTHGALDPGCILLESGEIAPTYAERSLGVHCPSLCASGKNDRFVVTALDPRGKDLLPLVAKRLPAAARITSASDRAVEGLLQTDLSRVSFQDRLCAPSHMDVLRALLLPCAATGEDARLPLGIFGCFAYDFVRQFESVPAAARDVLDDPDYVFYLATRLFITDHTRRITTLVSLTPDTAPDSDARADIDEMRDALAKAPPPDDGCRAGTFRSDTSKQEFCEAVSKLQIAVSQGRVYQTVLGRTLEADITGRPFEAYRNLKRRNPSPYMFYMRDEHGVLLGASPELAVRVWTENDRRLVEIRPIAGTKPRGSINGSIDPALDERYEVSLMIDTKELAEHTMLIDLARNDVASISKTGTTRLAKAFVVEKYSHVQHLVSSVRGELRDDLDCFDAYLATMNMGTLTGAPKPEAMKLIARHEQSARGFFGGGVGFLTANGEMETAIVIRAMRIRDDRVYIRAGAGIVADSIPEQEWMETARKAEACMLALKDESHEPEGPQEEADTRDR